MFGKRDIDSNVWEKRYVWITLSSQGLLFELCDILSCLTVQYYGGRCMGHPNKHSPCTVSDPAVKSCSFSTEHMHSPGSLAETASMRLHPLAQLQMCHHYPWM